MLFYIHHNDKEYKVRVEAKTQKVFISWDNQKEEEVDLYFQGNDCSLIHDNEVFHANVVGSKSHYTVWQPEGPIQLEVESEYRRLVGLLKGQDLHHEHNLYAKMPGKIVKIMGKKGQKVEKGDLPNIYLLHGELEDREINLLYNHPKIKAMVNLTKGEGYGRPLLEFSVMAKPVIASGWSGHTDFLHSEFSTLIRGEIKQIHPSAVVPKMLLPESGWFTPDYMTVGLVFKDVFDNYDEYLEKAKRQAYKSKTEFSLDSMTELLKSYLVKATENLPKQIELKLPNISKISLPSKIKI
jgi:biotin carboxyl carrier protein